MCLCVYVYMSVSVCACACARARARVRVCVCVCVCERERERECHLCGCVITHVSVPTFRKSHQVTLLTPCAYIPVSALVFSPPEQRQETPYLFLGKAETPVLGVTAGGRPEIQHLCAG